MAKIDKKAIDLINKVLISINNKKYKFITTQDEQQEWVSIENGQYTYGEHCVIIDAVDITPLLDSNRNLIIKEIIDEKDLFSRTTEELDLIIDLLLSEIDYVNENYYAEEILSEINLIVIERNDALENQNDKEFENK